HERAAPRPLDVTDHRERAAPRVTEEPARELGDEGARRDGRAYPECLSGEVVEERCPRAVAGEVEGDEPEQARIVRDVVGGEVEVLRDGPAAPRERPRPVLAEERPLLPELARVLLGEAHPVAGREDQRRGLRAAEEPGEPRLGGAVPNDGVDLPRRL